MKIVIIGAGPTGLGAGYRLKELEHENFVILEKNPYIGGLSASFRDDKGFTWDIGGHVLFSHYDYFDDVFEKLMQGDYLEHLREAWIWLMDRFVPYPFQNNIKYLPKKEVLRCLLGLMEAQEKKTEPKNFREWIYSVFGEGIAELFLVPDNWKRWSYPVEKMDMSWIAERISVIDIKRILSNVILDLDDVSWGPNNKFKFPLNGGTGGFFNKFNEIIGDKIQTGKEITGVDLERKKVSCSSESIDYDVLINTMPLDLFVKAAKLKQFNTQDLEHNDEYIVGIGLKGKTPSSKCWMYFPENNCPFYRVTYFTNYSPKNSPEGHWSLMCETTYSKYKPVDNIIENTIKGLINVKLLKKTDQIVSKYLIDAKYSYPVISLGRDKALKTIQKHLMANNVFSRGRFGAWKYEIGNMDHCFMQGVEVVDRILKNKEEKTWQNTL